MIKVQVFKIRGFKTFLRSWKYSIFLSLDFYNASFKSKTKTFKHIMFLQKSDFSAMILGFDFLELRGKSLECREFAKHFTSSCCAIFGFFDKAIDFFPCSGIVFGSCICQLSHPFANPRIFAKQIFECF